jgi:aerobic carbon-monoxide dehydrogenase small subunit
VTDRHLLQLSVNGDRYEISVEARTTLADALRDECRLTGTHLGCEHGVCGACTVLVNAQPVRSCLMFAIQAEGTSIRTVEGLAPDKDTLHPAQQAFWDAHALQCGFCTPGFLCLLVGFLEENPEADIDQIRDVLSSNLCRCTGYQNIVTAALTTQRLMQALGVESAS